MPSVHVRTWKVINTSHKRKDFFEMVGGATGLRKSELQSIKASALETERDVDGFYYFEFRREVA